MAEERYVGLDFGTTNSALVSVELGQPPKVFEFEFGELFRSVLHYEKLKKGQSEKGLPYRATGGEFAIRRFRELGGEGRMLHSLKSFLGSESFSGTQIFSKDRTPEDLVEDLLGVMLDEAERKLGGLGDRLVVGRPVHFVSQGAGIASDEGQRRQAGDDNRAESRLREALWRLGFDDVVFVEEPVAAALQFSRSCSEDARCLIADFGGGTSDFSALEIKTGAAPVVKSVAGVGIAGNNFGARIVRNALVPLLGGGLKYFTNRGALLAAAFVFRSEMSERGLQVEEALVRQVARLVGLDLNGIRSIAGILDEWASPYLSALHLEKSKELRLLEKPLRPDSVNTNGEQPRLAGELNLQQGSRILCQVSFRSDPQMRLLKAEVALDFMEIFLRIVASERDIVLSPEATSELAKWFVPSRVRASHLIDFLIRQLKVLSNDAIEIEWREVTPNAADDVRGGLERLPKSLYCNNNKVSFEDFRRAEERSFFEEERDNRGRLPVRMAVEDVQAYWQDRRAHGEDSPKFLSQEVFGLPQSVLRGIESEQSLLSLRQDGRSRDLQKMAMGADPHTRRTLEFLVELIDEEIGFDFFEEVKRVKEQLSASDEALFSLKVGAFSLETDIVRSEFEGWISGDVQQLVGCAREAVFRAGWDRNEVSRIFLTGGTSFVPILRNSLRLAFPAATMEAGDEFLSVGAGLALRAEELFGGESAR